MLFTSWFFTESVGRLLLYTICSRSSSWYIQDQDLNPQQPQWSLCPASWSMLPLLSHECGSWKREVSMTLLFLSSCSVLWAAVVEKCRVINNSYINAKAAGREMSVGNGISNKYKFHNSANFLGYFLQQVFLNLSYGGVLNVEETYLLFDIWSRYVCDIKMKAFAAI